MSKYTTEVRFICEQLSGNTESKGYAKVNEIIEQSRSKIFDFPYPIYDENYRSVLETKILKHFYTREIGSETVGLWKLWLDTRMNEIMPYYNQRYKSTLLEFNPLFDTDITTDRTIKNDGSKDDNGTTSDTLVGTKVGTNEVTESTQTVGSKIDDTTGTKNTTGSSTNETNEIDSGSKTNKGTRTLADDTTVTDNGTATTHSTGSESKTGWEYYSDTPQGGIDGFDLTHLGYLTNATHTTSNTSTTNDSNGTTADTSVTDKDVTETTNNTETTSANNKTTVDGSTTGEETSTGHLTEATTGESVKNITGRTTENTTNNNNGTSTMNSVFTNTEDYIEHVVGKRSGLSYSTLLEEFRKTFINIDMEIIHELDDLFMNLW